MPTRLVRLGTTQLLSIHTLEHTATVIDCSDYRLKLVGTRHAPETRVERGEVAFYSAKLSHHGWMSCSSCHVDGHSPDLLADTLSDGDYGNPKRIPSLMHTANTKPWGWDGSKGSLEEQVSHSIETTMHRDAHARDDNADEETLASDIAAYLRTLSPPSIFVPESHAVASGKSIFSDRGCIKCHDPKNSYTSHETYDVGVTDEMGQTKFNPPSLTGMRHRRSYFHDSRFKTLDKLLLAHPEPQATWSQKDLSNLKAFLISL